MNGLEYQYILVENKVVPCPDIDQWAEWLKDVTKRIIKVDEVEGAEDDGSPFTARVSTVFLGSDHSFSHGDPILFETMIFDTVRYEGFQDRYTSVEGAIEGHNRIVDLIRKEEDII